MIQRPDNAELIHTKPHIMKVVGEDWACMSATPGVMHEGRGPTPVAAYADWCKKHDDHRWKVIRQITASYHYPSQNRIESRVRLSSLSEERDSW